MNKPGLVVPGFSERVPEVPDTPTDGPGGLPGAPGAPGARVNKKQYFLPGPSRPHWALFGPYYLAPIGP